jgi:hypothetical protein
MVSLHKWLQACIYAHIAASIYQSLGNLKYLLITDSVVQPLLRTKYLILALALVTAAIILLLGVCI